MILSEQRWGAHYPRRAFRGPSPADSPRPDNLAKPPSSARALFYREHSKVLKASGIKSNFEILSDAWDKLSSKEQNDYKIKCSKYKEEYKTEYERLKHLAVENGEYPRDEPKRPVNNYIMFKQEKYQILKSKYEIPSDKKLHMSEEELKMVREKNKRALESEISTMWKNLLPKEKDKYTARYDDAKKQYILHYAEWSKQEAERIKSLEVQ